MKFKAKIMDELAVNRALARIAYEIIERSENLDNLVFVGIKTRGVPISKILVENIYKNTGIKIPVFEVDITHYRDDATPEIKINKIKETKIEAEGKDVIIVDDVLFTGRTTRACIDAIFEHSRAKSIRLAVLVDRGHRELPIRADFVGKNTPTSIKEKVSVKIKGIDDETSVEIYENT